MRTFEGLPEKAFVQNTLHCQGPEGEPPVIAIIRGEPGYCHIYTKATAEQLNKSLGVTPAQAEAMLIGSMCGWHVPGANPAYHVSPPSEIIEPGANQEAKNG